MKQSPALGWSFSWLHMSDLRCLIVEKDLVIISQISIFTVERNLNEGGFNSLKIRRCFTVNRIILRHSRDYWRVHIQFVKVAKCIIRIVEPCDKLERIKVEAFQFDCVRATILTEVRCYAADPRLAEITKFDFVFCGLLGVERE